MQRDFLEGNLAAYERTKNGVSGKRRGGRCVPVCMWFAVWGWDTHTHKHTLKYQREKPPFTKTFSHTNTHLHSETAPLHYFSLRPGHTHTFTHLLTVLFCSWLVGCDCQPGADTSGDSSSVSSWWPFCSPSCAHPRSPFPGKTTSAAALER